MFDEKLNGQNTQSKEGIEKLRKMLEITEIEKERYVYKHMRLLCTRFLSTSPLIFFVCTRVLVMGRQGMKLSNVYVCVCAPFSCLYLHIWEDFLIVIGLSLNQPPYDWYVDESLTDGKKLEWRSYMSTLSSQIKKANNKLTGYNGFVT